MTGPTLPLIVLFITCGVTVFYLLKSRHMERMARIEHGMDEKNGGDGHLLLNLGLFLGFLGLGLMSAFGCAYLFGTREYIFVPGFLLIFGGLSLIIAFFMQKRKV